MSNEVETKSEVEVLEKAAEKVRGPRGEVGTGSPGSRLKQLYAESGRGLSLKTFVRDQAKAGNVDAKTWLDNKKGLNEQARTKESVARILLQKSATKLAKKSKGKAGKGAGATTGTVA